MKKQKVFLFFSYKNPLSNFYYADIKFKTVKFVINGEKIKQYLEDIFPTYVDEKGFITFHSTEQFFMFCKALVFKDTKRAEQILNTETPYGCKKHGKLVLNFEENTWSLNKIKIMYRANLKKFRSNPNIKEYLLETDPLILGEASPWDKIWGIGLGKKDPNAYYVEEWVGKNLLGKILMKVRKKIMKEDAETVINNILP